jgi:Fe-S-cluster containining protein
MDYTLEDFFVYKQYLNTIDIVLKGYFEDQKEYIFCKKGCSHCCETGQYPYTDLEFKYLLLGFFKIPMQEQQKVIKRIQDLKKEYQNAENKKEFRHRCPFLDDEGVCTVYEYRGMICRTFGLITMLDEGGCVIPFCQELGLNYSNVYDPINKKIDMEKVKKLGFKNIPHPRRTSLKTIMSPEMFEGDSPIDFGERKALIEWL